MSIFKRNKEFYNTPFRLTDEQKKNPIKALQDLFGSVDLADSRETLADLIHVALITDNLYFDEPRKRSDAIFVCRQIEKTLEAAYLLLPKKKK